jgi:hypothetical protein
MLEVEGCAKSTGPALALGQPAVYQITVQGWLAPDWSDWFDGLIIATGHDSEGSPVTSFTGQVIDQAALHGVLRKLYGLGLPLISIACLDRRATTPAEETEPVQNI